MQQQAIFFIGLTFSLFIFWMEAKKDGFPTKRLFDIFFIIFSFWFFSNFFLDQYLIYFHKAYLFDFKKISLYSFYFFIFSLGIFLSKKWNFSLYRILDMLALSSLFSGAIAILSTIILNDYTSGIWLFLGLMLVFFVLHTFRTAIFSGGTFLLVSSIFVIYILSSYKDFFDLLFICIVVVNSVLFLLSRIKKTGQVSFKINSKKFKKEPKMLTRQLDSSFIEIQKEKLLMRRTQLEAELKELSTEDPYLQPGRDTEASEYVEEAVLEDEAKIQYDVKVGRLKELLAQVNKALSRIDSGDYGICEVTGQPIDKARLEAYPEVTISLDAERESEL